MWIALREMLFPVPEDCLWCGKPGAAGACDLCRRDLAFLPPDRCPRCLRPVTAAPAVFVGKGGRTAGGTPPRCRGCRVRPPAYAGVTCLGLYRGLLRWTVNAVKERGQRFLLPPLAELLARGLDADAVAYDVVTVPPLDPRRLRRRGFHPARVLADHLAANRGRPYAPRLLERVRPIPPQSGLTGSERRHNWRGAVVAAAGAEGWVRGRRVLLVDDVVTTGSTLDAAARALLTAGASTVWAAVMADSGPGPIPV